MHRIADIHDHVAAQVGFFLELLDVKLVGFGPDFPVEMANVVARRVVAVLDEFDRMAKERAAVHAGDETFHDLRARKSRREIRAMVSGCKKRRGSSSVFLAIFNASV